ncbi:unknown [Spodoptera litura nucleopolyhedrovirus]|uniref:Ac76 n=1 Tax=Spodoptera litura multicapsid nucleopolyhedrovirus TaxID=46242 RepID=Q91BF2_NPVST|nr:hypothetical protein [Spodoptera litura nucleopolyhedrovirus]WML75137.1 hypothetical protein KBIHDJOI_00094 [Spodoptera littoralis nucleopolyhedrovirus]AAL01755.1 unknown [Spodoptera litura nucleopolyhedrovirus]QHN73922.1 hypothetical protein [Spodoptera litura nucleopolyhedrovirus]UQV25607.1 hypothetical protein [Spodoptera litura nucleopolyhedrovirus]WOC30931.1 hypothetical protein GACBDANE_00062 [Spodoptera litura nucleopolyhedrovirus]
MLIFFTFILITLSFIFDRNNGMSNLILFVLLLFIIFVALLHVYYVKPASNTTDLQTDKSKRIKKKRDLEKALDAIINKNTSSTD